MNQPQKIKQNVMQKLNMKMTTKYLAPFWLGVSLGIVGYNILTWQFWFVVIPTTLLYGLFWSYETNN